jgi:hypothetical protein
MATLLEKLTNGKESEPGFALFMGGNDEEEIIAKPKKQSSNAFNGMLFLSKWAEADDYERFSTFLTEVVELRKKNPDAPEEKPLYLLRFDNRNTLLHIAASHGKKKRIPFDLNSFVWVKL